jgi:hypothetical protein
MANRLYNQQVSPKGYKRGGGVDVKKAKEFRKNRKTPIRTFFRNTMEGKYMDPRRSTAEPIENFFKRRRKKFKRGGGVTGGTTTTKSESKPKKKNIIQRLRKKYLPTFGEQFSKAKKEGKKVFRSTRDDTTKGKLEYSTKTAAEVKAAKKRLTDRERARSGDTSKQLSEKSAAFKLARKSGKKTFTHKGKKYSTLLKGEKPDKIMPELSGKTSKKIKKLIG